MRLWLLLLAGCGVTFPDEARVEDLRILEIRLDPPEIPIFQTPKLDAEPEELLGLQPAFDQAVEVTVLMAHPDVDAELTAEPFRCTTGRPFARVPCSAEQKTRLDAPVFPIELLFQDLTLENQDAIVGLASDPRDLFNGFRAFVNVSAAVAGASISVDTPRLEGTKRLIVYDPTTVSLVVRQAQQAEAAPTLRGLDLPSLCTEATAEEVSDIMAFLGERRANRRPTYQSVEVLTDADTSTRTYEPGDPPLVIGPGGRVQLRGRVDPSDLEPYRVIDNRCRLVDFDESAVWSWFTNVGSFSDNITFEGKTRSDVFTVYRAPLSGELEADETRVRIWSVLRDGRGGSDSRTVELVIMKGR